jgi:hypothetical protein
MVFMGCNLANVEAWERCVFTYEKKHCVFISHKKEDEDAAIAIGKYLTDTVGVNIYLDTQDCVLEEAVSSENDQLIVDSIKRGLACSSDLLCLISDKTKLSWWVPYEIGYADKQSMNIAVLKLKDIEDIPSYLKIKKTLLNTEDFLQYVSQLGPYGSIMAKEDYSRFSKCDNKVLTEYID